MSREKSLRRSTSNSSRIHRKITYYCLWSQGHLHLPAHRAHIPSCGCMYSVDLLNPYWEFKFCRNQSRNSPSLVIMNRLEMWALEFSSHNFSKWIGLRTIIPVVGERAPPPSPPKGNCKANQRGHLLVAVFFDWLWHVKTRKKKKLNKHTQISSPCWIYERYFSWADCFTLHEDLHMGYSQCGSNAWFWFYLASNFHLFSTTFQDLRCTN